MVVELQNKRTDLLAKFRPDDRLVQEVSQQITDTQAALDKVKSLNGADQATDINPVRQALELDIARLQDELEGLEARRQTLEKQNRGYGEQLEGLGNSTTVYDDLTRNEKEAEENYLLYARKSEEARIADSLDKQKIANVAIAENPVEPHLPSKPNVPLSLALGTLLAACVSVGGAYSREYLQRTQPAVETDSRHLLEFVERASDLEALTSLPVLGITRRSS
jgi:uncharacterized protein involved in exopolysaccharide biosynthesis